MAWKLKIWKLRHRTQWESIKMLLAYMSVLFLFALIASLDEILTWF